MLCSYHVLTISVTLIHIGPSDKKVLYLSFFYQQLPAGKDFIHGILHSCWAKWVFVIGQKCTAGSVKFSKEKFSGNLLSSEIKKKKMNVTFIYIF